MEQTFRPIPTQVNYIQPSNRSERADGDTIVSQSKIDVPLFQNKAVSGTTYTEKYFDNAERSEDGVNLIEEFIQSIIEKNSLNETSKTYDDLMEDLFEKLGIDENETQTSKYNKVVRYIEMLSRDKSRDDRKKEMLKIQRKEEAERARKEAAIKEMSMQKEVEKYKSLAEDQKNKVESLKSEVSKLLNKSKEEQSALLAEIKAVNSRHELSNQANKLIFEKNMQLRAELDKAIEREQSLLLRQKKLRELI